MGARKEHVYLTIRQYAILIYTAQRIVRRLSLRLNKSASATATEMGTTPAIVHDVIIFIENHVGLRVVYGFSLENRILFSVV